MLLKLRLSFSLLNIAAIFLAFNDLGVDVAPADISLTFSMIPSEGFLRLDLGVSSRILGERSSHVSGAGESIKGEDILEELCPS